MKLAFFVYSCGIFGGTENNELTLAMLAATNIGATFKSFAPNDRCDLMDPCTKDPFNPSIISKDGNMLNEAAKLVRGEIEALDKLKPKEYDALIIPGGYGAINILSNLGKFIVDPKCSEKLWIHEGFKNTVLSFYKEKKPIVAICLAPFPTACVINNKCKITLGKNQFQIPDVEIKYENTTSAEFVYDEANKLYSTPAVTYGPDLTMMYKGIQGAFDHLKLNFQSSG